MSQLSLNTISNGDSGDAMPVMENFNTLKNRINLGVESDNIAANAVNGSHINLGAYILKLSKGADVASASAVTLGNDGNFFDITGTTTITSITAKSAGTVVYLQFDGILTVTDGSNLKLGSNFVTAAESTLALVSDGTNWYELSRSPAVTFTPSASNALTGSVIQVVNTQTGAVATGTTVIPYDDTIPQNTEGDEYMTRAITPSATTNKLKITVVFNGISSAGVSDYIVALFQDTTAGALAAVRVTGAGANSMTNGTFVHYMDAGTTSSTTFKVRAGTISAGTLTFNGSVGGRIFGGVTASSITIEEVKQ
jgi:hypothetical protein